MIFFKYINKEITNLAIFESLEFQSKGLTYAGPVVG